MGQAKKIDNALDVGACMTVAIRALSLRDRSVLFAYTGFMQRRGLGDVCWPTDAEVATSARYSIGSVRRARAALVASRFVSVAYVAPGGRLPGGETAAHGANVVTLAAHGAASEGLAQALTCAPAANDSPSATSHNPS